VPATLVCVSQIQAEPVQPKRGHKCAYAGQLCAWWVQKHHSDEWDNTVWGRACLVWAPHKAAAAALLSPSNTFPASIIHRRDIFYYPKSSIQIAVYGNNVKPGKVFFLWSCIAPPNFFAATDKFLVGVFYKQQDVAPGPLKSSFLEAACNYVGLAKTVHRFTVHDRLYGEFSANSTVCSNVWIWPTLQACPGGTNCLHVH